MFAITEACKYTFEPQELVGIARKQAQLMNDRTAQEELFDQLKADHKSKITRLETDISDCTRRDSEGGASPVPAENKTPLSLRDPKGGNWNEWPQDLRVREFPEGR